MTGELICVLEHDPLTLRLMAEDLEEEGFATLRLSEAMGSLAAIKEYLADLVVLDTSVEIGEIAWTLLESIRSDGDLRKMPVIVCISDPGALEKRSALLKSPPETAVLVKPFTPEALTAMITAMLAARRGEAGRDVIP